HPNILHHSTSTTCSFQSNSSIGTVENRVADNNIFHATRHLATYHHASVAAKHNTISDRVVFCRNIHLPSRSIFSRFYGNTIVSHADITVSYPDVSARLGIHPISIRGWWVFDSHSIDIHIIAILRVDCPKWGVYNFNI